MHRVQRTAWLAFAVMAGGVAATPADQHVEITGTRLRRRWAEAVTPVQVITRDDIAQLGVGSLRGCSTRSDGRWQHQRHRQQRLVPRPVSAGASLRFLGQRYAECLTAPPYPLADYARVFTNIDACPSTPSSASGR